MRSKINETLQNKNKHFEKIFLSDDVKIITNQKSVTSKFNHYIVNVAKNLLKDKGELNNKFQNFIKTPNEHSFFINETGPIEVSNLLDKINVYKATDICGSHLNW